jgi:hypothetical protein
MTESPGPLSPGQHELKHRAGHPESAPSSLQHHSQHYSRGSSSSAVGLPPLTGANQLPPIAPMTHDSRGSLSRSHQASNRASLQSPHGPGPSMLQQQISAPSPGTPSNSASSPRQKVDELYDYIRQLDSRFAQMQDSYEARIRTLEDEISGLRGQQAQPHPSQHQTPTAPPAPPAPQAPMTAQPGTAAH